MSSPSHTARVLLADRDHTTLKILESTLPHKAFNIIATDKGTDAYTLAVNRLPSIILLDADLPGFDGCTLCRRLRQDSRTQAIPIIMLTGDDRVPARLAAFEAGADDLVVKPFHPKELAFRIRNLIERRTPSAPPAQERGGTHGRITAFFGTKGGIGKTTLSINFAVALKQRGAKRVALLDSDFALGTVGVCLDLAPTHTISDLIDHFDSMDEDLLKQVMVPHSSGVQVLQCPASPEESEVISADHVRRILRLMSSGYDHVVVDCDANYDERILVILEMADNVVFIITPEIHVIKNCASFFNLVRRMKIDPEKFQILLNRAGSNPVLKTSDLEEAIKHRINFEVRSDGRALLRSANHGVPIVMDQPNHPISVQMKSIADAFLRLPPAENHEEPEADEEHLEPIAFKPKVLAAARG